MLGLEIGAAGLGFFCGVPVGMFLTFILFLVTEPKGKSNDT